MAGSFYARYVPQKRPVSAEEFNDLSTQKRRQNDTNNDHGGKRKKPKKYQEEIQIHAPKDEELIPQSNGTNIPTNKKAEASKVSTDYKGSKKATAPSEEDFLSKYSVTKYAQSLKTESNLRNRGESSKDATITNGTPQSTSKDDIRKTRSMKTNETTVADTTNGEASIGDEVEGSDDSDIDTKHSSVITKYKRSRDNAAKVKNSAPETEIPVPDQLHGLEPLPQPAPVPASSSKPTYSTLPEWLAHPMRISPSERRNFQDLLVDQSIVQNLVAKSITEAFSIQCAALPSLLPGSQRYNGDICISAATGSGKTLAYALPMIQALKAYVTTGLRGLVVVPTRELVQQVREVCEICAIGSGLKIASAVGNRSLPVEADILVEQREAYHPTPKESMAPMSVEDWSHFDLAEFMSEARSRPQGNPFATTYQSKVDILICTPGRLVEHLRSTKGFTLDELEWLIIDEADRLLNESFQDWVDIVIPALQASEVSSSRTKTGDILRQMRMMLPPRSIQKVILSATFSSDISKLNSLSLRNPKLIVLGEKDFVDDESVVRTKNGHGTLSLPTGLVEFAIPVGDGSEKPLYLLSLIRSKLKERGTISAPAADRSTSSSSDSSNDSDDSESASTSDSETAETDLNSNGSRAKSLIFTSSTESAERLFRLLSILAPDLSDKIATLTKSSTSSSRRSIATLRRGKSSILIATDRASRGLDIPELDHVISYDVPNSVTTYVHRVGRTARAGMTGQAWTLLAHREARWFWKEIGTNSGENNIARSGKVQKLTLNIDASEEIKQAYDDALKALGAKVREKR